MFSNTFAGIAPSSAPGFVVAQLVGAAAAIAVVRVLYPDVTPDDAAQVVLPHDDGRARGSSEDQAGVTLAGRGGQAN